MKTQTDIFINKSGSKKCTNLRTNSLAVVKLIPQKNACCILRYCCCITKPILVWQPQHSRESQICHNI